ncbi:MAG: ATPase domain-containing protein, partial [Nanoarchaeota archaeon]|nr:ATPase domain-containing protein [Nanoarchaeota archaeon]
MERIKTGIKGFDELNEGGFPKGSTILICGMPGTGKTIFALQYLFNGAAKFNEKCLYVSFEEEKRHLIEQAMQFGWDIEKLEKKGLFKMVNIDSKNIDNDTIQDICDVIMKNNITRVVIDSLSTLSINTPAVHTKISELGNFAVKRFLYSFISSIRTLGVTSMLISQTSDEKSLSTDGISEFLCDGIIHISFESMGGAYSRSLSV